MSVLSSILPQPKSHVAPLVIENPVRPEDLAPKKQPPPYGSRQGWIPREVEDFGDGGAFPEIHVAQYPLDMGRKRSDGKSSNSIVPLALDADGKVKFDAIISKGNSKVVYSRAQDLVPKQASEELLERPDPEVEAETTAKTKAALEKIINGKVLANRTAGQVTTQTKTNEPTYVRYTPQDQISQNGANNQKIIRLVEMPVDPLEPAKFKHKKVPRGPPSPPPPVMHSPPRKVSKDEIADWNIPPCISNWKNPRGYTIPLDKRLAADGRGLQQVQINDNFAKIAEALYTAERTARDEVTQRAMIRERLARKEMEAKEEMLRKLAQETREKRAAGLAPTSNKYETEEDEEKAERDRIREERKRDRERERRMEAMGKKTKALRDEDRDISEKIALGEIPAGTARSSEALYDQRLFNQSMGMDSGFGSDESYNIYDKAMHAGTTLGQLYKPKKGENDEEEISEGTMKRILDTTRFKPDKGFSGANAGAGQGRGSQPVEFEKVDESDPFGLEELLSQAKTGAKKLDKVGQGHMHAATSGGSSSGKRGAVEFESSGGHREKRQR